MLCHTAQQLAALRRRLERASDALYGDGQYGQALARIYYLIYHYVRTAGYRLGIQVCHRWDSHETLSRDYQHDEIADVVEAIYSGSLQPGSCVRDVGTASGIQGSLSSDDAWELVNELRKARVAADYEGYNSEVPKEFAERLKVGSKRLRADLQRYVSG